MERTTERGAYRGCNLRLEVDTQALEPDLLLALVRGLAPLGEDEEKSVVSVLSSASSWIRESFPDVTSVDLNDHVTYYLEYLERVGWPAKQAALSNALQLVVESSAASWLSSIDEGLAAQLRAWGIPLVAKSSETSINE